MCVWKQNTSVAVTAATVKHIDNQTGYFNSSAKVKYHKKCPKL